MDAATDGEEGRWMTYAELAAIRGIDRQSAARLSWRRHWRRQKDNHGTLRVFVPVEWQDGSQDASRDEPRDTTQDVSRDISRVIKPLEEAIATLREQSERAITALKEQQEHERTALREQVDRERGRADAADLRADRAEARAEALHDRLTAAEADRDRARAQAHTAQDELRQVEAERRVRGRWARLRAAWRGE
jgi:hypothetical protein